MNQKPSIGRIVHFEDGFYGTCAAIISNVLSDEDVLLALLQKTIPQETEPLIVYHRAKYSENPQIGHWSWPPRI